MNYYENQCRTLYQMIKETENHKFDDYSRKEILTELSSVFSFFLDQINKPNDILLVMEAEQTLIKRTNDFEDGYRIPLEIENHKFETEIMIYRLLEEEYKTGIKAMIPTADNPTSEYLSPALYLKVDVSEDILKLKYIPSDHEAVWDVWLKKHYLLGKMIVETYKL